MLFVSSSFNPYVAHWKLSELILEASHAESQMFPATSLSHHHLTSIIGLLLFVYFCWQANRGEVTQSRQILLARSGEYGSELSGLRTTAWLILQILKRVEIQNTCL